MIRFPKQISDKSLNLRSPYDIIRRLTELNGENPVFCRSPLAMTGKIKGEETDYETWYRCKPTAFHFLNKDA